MIGKLKPNQLMKYVFSRVGIKDPEVIVGPSIGEDAAIVDIGGGKILAIHVDPISGALEYLGWLAVHVASNDIAVRGVKPRWLLPVLYLPEDADEHMIDSITSQIDSAAKEIGAMVVGGHSEFTSGLRRPLISMTAAGVTLKDKYVRTGGAREGDVILMTKTAGIEGTAILASDFSDVLLSKGISKDLISSGKEYIKNVSVVKEALLLADHGLATSMHDPTEGGVLGGLLEISYASGVSIEVYEEAIPVGVETEAFCRALGLDPLRILSSGTLLAAVPKGLYDRAIESLESSGIKATIIGKVLRREDFLVRVIRRDGSSLLFNDVYVVDEVIKLWSER